MEDLIKVYIKIDENNYITDINSSIFWDYTTNYIQIDEGIGDKYAHAQGNYLLKGISDSQGRYNYKYENEKVTELTEEEKENLYSIQEKQPNKEEMLEEQLLQTQAAFAELQANILLNQGGIA